VTYDVSGQPTFSLLLLRTMLVQGSRLVNLHINVATLDRYRIIRNFFRNQHTVVPQTLISSSQCPLKPPKLTAAGRATELISTQHRSFHPSTLRPSQFPENSQKKHEDPTRTLANSNPQSPHNPLSNQEQHAPPPRNDENYSRFFRRLALSLPHPHRPTRDDFLNVATGFWQRLRIRFKWFTIKSFRKFNADDISAFITWFLMSQTLWILVGT